jgi:hypothetical protein
MERGAMRDIYWWKADEAKRECCWMEGEQMSRGWSGTNVMWREGNSCHAYGVEQMSCGWEETDHVDGGRQMTCRWRGADVMWMEWMEWNSSQVTEGNRCHVDSGRCHVDGGEQMPCGWSGTYVSYVWDGEEHVMWIEGEQRPCGRRGNRCHVEGV